MATEQSTEKRSERVTLACTAREREALELISVVREDLYKREPSTVLRDYSLADAVAYADSIKSAITVSA